jgi:Protein of unknown function (DUF1329)
MRITMWRCNLLIALLVLLSSGVGQTEVKPGDTITKDNIAQAEGLLPPFVRWLVEQGMPIPVIETRKAEWPKAYKEATEKYSGQVKLSADGRSMYNYVAGSPFPKVDLNDPLVGYKLMWNHEHGPYIIDNVGTEWILELVNSNLRFAHFVHGSLKLAMTSNCE